MLRVNYFQCNRCGSQRPRRTGKRRGKFQGASSGQRKKSLLCRHIISRSLFQTKRNLEITYYKYHFNLLNAIGDIYLSVFLHIFRSSVSFFLIMLHRYFIVLNLHKQSIRNDFNSFSFNDGILCIFLFTGTCKIDRNCTSTLNVC